MDDKLVYKVAKRGEGKTRWLLKKADEALRQGKEVYLATNSPIEYRNFIEKFFGLYNRICTVHQLTTHSDITSFNSVILMDDLFRSNFHPGELEQLAHKCERMYITLTGVTEKEVTFMQANDDSYVQLTIDDVKENN